MKLYSQFVLIGNPSDSNILFKNYITDWYAENSDFTLYKLGLWESIYTITRYKWMQWFCSKRCFLQLHNILEIIAKSCLSGCLLITWQMGIVCFQTEVQQQWGITQEIKQQSKYIFITVIPIVRVTFLGVNYRFWLSSSFTDSHTLDF